MVAPVAGCHGTPRKLFRERYFFFKQMIEKVFLRDSVRRSPIENVPVTLDDIVRAQRRIRDTLPVTPCARAVQLSARSGCELFLKCENLQMTGSFKVRGALARMLQLTAAEQAAGVIAASAGNHAQGVAYAAQRLGIPATIVMPETAPLAKVRGTAAFGARIVLAGNNYDAAYARAVELQRESGATFIHAFDDPGVMAGQGSVALELLEQLADFDAVLVPVGGGGLVGGIATVIKQVRPGVRVIGVQTARVPGMLASLRAGALTAIEPAATLADGIAVARVGQYTFAQAEAFLDEVVSVDEEAIARAILALLEQEKLLAEGAGAVGVAALLEGAVEDLAGKRVVAVLSGGNIDPIELAKLIGRGLEQDGRLAHLRVLVGDRPGAVAEVAAIVARARANILQISQRRDAAEVGLREAELELALETRGRDHVEDIVAALRAQGLRVK